MRKIEAFAPRTRTTRATNDAGTFSTASCGAEGGNGSSGDQDFGGGWGAIEPQVTQSQE
ncbi:hypothetical protein GCM10007385_46090 [Tateyamaria omphalii]|uniref:hypothetical protein n=1 Tax=Tateyamaria omphalii TaxID=299262 RepID=UPI0016775FD5|nr:hypothetical protein [Tateyamaria omphalii]GGX72069.1 hypothetical protein GCM10007385_46090 [Tateyamaria omphalii]